MYFISERGFPGSVSIGPTVCIGGGGVYMCIYLCAASGCALRWERLAFRGAGLSTGDEVKGLSQSTRGASGLVLAEQEEEKEGIGLDQDVIKQPYCQD